MRDGVASRTAQYMALFRALETIRPERERLFADPQASAFLDRGLRAAVTAARVPLLGGLVPAYIDRRWPGPRASGVLRTRVIDDAVRAALDDGARQVVILGAGFDTRALRLARSGVRYFEVDHPDTQALKRAAGTVDGTRYVAVDFAREEVGPALAAAGLEDDARTLFLWEGVLSYLEPPAIDAMLRWMAVTGGPGSSVVFTYVDRAALTGPRTTSPGGRRWSEPESRFVPGSTLRRWTPIWPTDGLRLVWDESTAESARRHRPAEASAIPPFYRVALAERALG